MSISGKAESFRALHVKGDPLILFNAWDAGSARAVAEAGAKAIATGSWSVAAAQGYADGEAMPLEEALANVARIVNSVELPVTIDFERGYAESPQQIAANVAAAAEAGAVGCNFEDGLADGGIRPAEDQAERIAAIGRATQDFFINARTDLFLHSAPETHESLVGEALERGTAYGEAGASGLFVPGLADESLIERICSECALPVNIMIWPGRTPPLRRLAELGVARISHAGGPWRIAMAALKEAATRAHNLEG